MAGLRSAKQQAALRKAQLASARKRRGHRRITKARAAKRKYVAKNRKRLASKRNQKRYIKEYKRTGLAMIDSGGKDRGYRRTVKSLRAGSKMNKKHQRKLAKHNNRIHRAIVRSR